MMEDPDELTKEDRVLISELFKSLEVAHSELASACSVLRRLSRNLKPRQLMVVLQASIRLLIQVKYWMRDWPVYSRNPVKAKSEKENNKSLSLRSFI